MVSRNYFFRKFSLAITDDLLYISIYTCLYISSFQRINSSEDRKRNNGVGPEKQGLSVCQRENPDRTMAGGKVSIDGAGGQVGGYELHAGAGGDHSAGERGDGGEDPAGGGATAAGGPGRSETVL